MVFIRAFLVILTACSLAVVGVAGAQDAGPPGPGQIAIAGSDGNIHLYDVASESFTMLTDDAVEGQRAYSWPTWSTDGQLAYFGASLIDDPPYRLGIFIQQVADDTLLDAVQVHGSAAEIFTYAYWSPGECPAGNCRDLAVLYTAETGNLAVRRVRSTNTATAADQFSVDELATGGPFYWDWSPDGQAMFWARFGERLEIYDVAGDEIVQTFDETQGLQRAVDWSPVDDRLLSAVDSGARRSDLVIFDGDERQVLAENLPGIISFEWSPDGTQVAYTDDDAGSLRVVDVASGEEIAVVSGNVIAFFWSPDGSQLAYITLTRETDGIAARRLYQDEGELVARWHVFDEANGLSTRLAGFLPSRDMLYYLQFFDQFARSHRLWSPDGRYIVYGAFDADEGEVVRLIDTTQPDSAPQTLMAGSIGVFSWQ
jgi:TolB protein